MSVSIDECFGRMFPSCQYGQSQCSLVWELYQIYDNKYDGDDDDYGESEYNDDDDGDNDALMMVW